MNLQDLTIELWAGTYKVADKVVKMNVTFTPTLSYTRVGTLQDLTVLHATLNLPEATYCKV